MLADGSEIIEGGEHNFGAFTLTHPGAICGPRKNTWAQLRPPSGRGYIGDSPATVLPNGHFLIGNKLTTQTADPARDRGQARPGADPGRRRHDD